MTDYMAKVIVLERSIYANDYYVGLWEKMKEERDITCLSDVELCELLNDFWYVLPDSRSIHREPFYELCDLCTEYTQTASEWVEILSSGAHIIEFTKKDGEYRMMTATRDMSLIRSYIPGCEDLEPINDDDTSIVVFDVEKKDWRRFMVDRLIDNT